MISKESCRFGSFPSFFYIWRNLIYTPLKNRFLLLIVLVLLKGLAVGQGLPEKGVPLLQNFKPAQYANKGKVWAIATSQNGMVYMAADGGLIEYDGKTWNTFKGSKGFTRSLLVLNDSTIFTGSDLDFGVWRKNKYQGFDYTSLYPFQKDVSDLYEEFWHVHRLENGILFNSFQNIYVYKNNQLTRISAPSRFTGSFSMNDSIYFADEKEGVFLFEGFALKRLFEYPKDEKFEIAGMVQQQNGLILVTKSAGLYLYAAGRLSPLKNKLSEVLKIARVFSFERISAEYLAFGTILQGLFITDSEGNIIHHVNKNKGLPNSTILSLHYSKSGKLWMGMDYGISTLDLKNNITYFIDYNGDFGTGATGRVIDELFYLGTNQGLYVTKWEDLNDNSEANNFQLVPGTEGQVWSLENVDQSLLIGHDKGLFAWHGNKLSKLGDQNGVLTILPYQDFLLTGNYNGISIYKKNNSSWSFFKKMELIYGSCSQLIIEKDNILWVNIPNFGVIRATLDAELVPTERLIFPDTLFQGDHVALSGKGENIQLVTEQHVYDYDPVEQKFNLLANEQYETQVEDLISGFYIGKPLHPDYNFYPVYNGFALKYLKYQEQKDTESHQVILREIEAVGNTEKAVYFENAIVPYHLNSLMINCIVPNQKDVQYQYKLQTAEDWSEWNLDHTIELINLKSGKHTLLVRALVNGEMTDNLAVTVRIATPWYLSWMAYIAYVLLALLGFFLIHYRQRMVLKKQKADLLVKEQQSLRMQAEKHEQELVQLEQKRIKAEFEQMKDQLKNKTVELATKAKDNEDKSRLLMLLKEKCNMALKEPNMTKIRLSEMQRLLESYISVEDKTFEIQMDELHQEFFKKLKDQFPNLSSNDMRWCAYLKIGLNSREIAEILNIQPSSAYIGRSRLRKKLNLNQEDDLYTFLNNI